MKHLSCKKHLMLVNKNTIFLNVSTTVCFKISEPSLSKKQNMMKRMALKSLFKNQI